MTTGGGHPFGAGASGFGPVGNEHNSSGFSLTGAGGPLGMTPASQMEMLVSSGLNASSAQDLEMY